MGKKHNKKNKRKKKITKRQILKGEINEAKRKHREMQLEFKARKAERSRHAEAILDKHQMPDKPRTKKLDYYEHYRYFSGRIHLLKYVRPPEKWEAKTYNLHRQRISYLQWVMCKYYVPLFLLDTFIGPGGVQQERQNDLEMFRMWAKVVGRGGSLYKEGPDAKELLTKKEIHYFLNFKEGTAEQNVWRARCKRHGVPPKFSTRMVSTLLRQGVSIRNERWMEFVEFVGKYKDEFEDVALSEIMDFLRVNWHNVRNLKGRTVSSLTRMSNDWHRVMGRTKFKGDYTTWPGCGIPMWKFQFKEDPTLWYIVEVTDSKDLYTEGNKLRHCVGSYSRLCAEGQANIFSLRRMDHPEANLFYRHVTIEVKSGVIYQARRKLNKRPTEEELTVIRRWAREHDIGAPTNAFSRYW